MRMIYRFLIFVVCLAAVAPVFAQEEGTRVVLTNGYSVRIPRDWDFEAEDGRDDITGFYLFRDRNLAMFVLDPAQVELLVDVANAEPTELALLLYNRIWGRPDERTATVEREIGGLAAADFTYEAEEFKGRFIVVELEEDVFGVFDAFNDRSGIPESVLETIEPVIVSMIWEAPPVTTTTGVDCFISTTSANTIPLRVGPGPNRASISWLPADQKYQVLGQVEADDGSIWFKLDKDTVLPHSAALELWVARDEVTGSGDCSAVIAIDLTAPVIPASNNPPSSNVGGSNNNPPPQQNNPPPANTGGNVPANMPASGRWTMYLNPTSAASCQGTESVSIPTSELVSGTSLSGQMSVNADGSGLTFSGTFFTRASDQSFVGSFTFENYNTQVYLNMSSPGAMGGQITFNVTVDNLPCSATIPLSMVRG